MIYVIVGCVFILAVILIAERLNKEHVYDVERFNLDGTKEHVCRTNYIRVANAHVRNEHGFKRIVIYKNGQYFDHVIGE